MLSDLSTERTAVPQIAFNEGIGGDDSFDLVYERLDSILKRYPGLDLVVLQIGTNDALGSGGTPSGEGCSYADPPQGHQENPQGVAWQSSCAGTFKGNVQWAINKIAAAGKSVMIPQLPPAFGGGGDPYDSPLSGKRNQRISQYNRVISNELTGYLPGADFFGFMLAGGENRFTLFDDNLHPNSLGTVVFGHLHHNADNPSSPVGDSLPFILEGLCVRVDSNNCENPTPYKQNLMQIGNHPYREGYKDDQATELLAIPGALYGGVWINTYNAHRNNARADYLDFNVDLVELGYGASYPDVEVFVLFDSSVSGASLPSWMGGFSQVFEGGLPVRVDTSSSTVPFMNVFKRTYRPDSGNLNVVLGGAESGTTGARANYLVVIKPLAAGGP